MIFIRLLDFYNSCAPTYGRAPVTRNALVLRPWRNRLHVESDHVYQGCPDHQGPGVHRRLRDALQGPGGLGELTGHITSAWSVTGGMRLFKQTIQEQQQTGLLFDGSDFIANSS